MARTLLSKTSIDAIFSSFEKRKQEQKKIKKTIYIRNKNRIININNDV